MFGKLAEFNAARRVKRLLAVVRHRLAADDDLLSADHRSTLNSLLADGAAVLKTHNPGTAAAFCAEAEVRFAQASLHRSKSFLLIREYLDIIAVVAAVAFGIRGLWLQPFKIPTGSMQPTLFGVHYVQNDDNFIGAKEGLPPLLNGLLFGADRAYAKTVDGGRYIPEHTQTTGSLFSTTTKFNIGLNQYALPGERRKVEDYANLNPRLYVPADKELANGYLVTGDQLFVERVSHLFFGLKRGDVVVFRTENIMGSDGRPLLSNSGYYYIKRLVGLPGDTLKIADGMLYVKAADSNEFKPITEFSDKFGRIFSGQGGYHGYLNGRGLSVPHLTSAADEFLVPEDSYFMLGDNSAGSLDSRSWGVVPRENIVGKAFFVFWPLSRRVGLADSKAALDVPTGTYGPNGFPAMQLQ